MNKVWIVFNLRSESVWSIVYEDWQGRGSIPQTFATSGEGLAYAKANFRNDEHSFHIVQDADDYAKNHGLRSPPTAASNRWHQYEERAGQS